MKSLKRKEKKRMKSGIIRRFYKGSRVYRVQTTYAKEKIMKFNELLEKRNLTLKCIIGFFIIK